MGNPFFFNYIWISALPSKAMNVAVKTYRQEEKCLNALAKSVIKTCLYFDIFQYPLLLDEVHKYCGYSASRDEIESQLGALVDAGYISRMGMFYQVADSKMEYKVDRRIKGNREAEKFLRIARLFSKFISLFPFVRGICLSGSLSKGYADRDTDIDYFIITEPGRLWISRTLLVLFKKLFLFGSHKYFCVNYFIDTNNLEIPDKNLFTATELLSIIPASNPQLYEKLMDANKWIELHYPNGNPKTPMYEDIPAGNGFLQKAEEMIFYGKLGDWADNFCFKITLAAWKRKFNHFNESEFNLNLRSRKNVSKHHPNGFQLKVMAVFEEKIKAFEERFNIPLH